MSTPKSKRSAEESDKSDDAPPTKKLASVFAKTHQVAPILSNNKLSYPKTIPNLNTLRLSTWNVRSLKDASSQAKEYAFRKYIEAEEPDLIVLTETAVTESEARANPTFDYLKTRYAGRYWAKKVAILSKTKALNVLYGLPDWAESKENEAKERVGCITLEFPTCFVIGAYVQNSGTDQKNMPARQAWNRDLRKYIGELQAGVKIAEQKSIIHLGDFNVLPELIDVQSSWVWDNFPGTLPIERKEHAELLSQHNLVDVYRHLHPNAREYTHTSVRYKGMRLDGFLVSRSFLLRVISCEIRNEVHEHYPHSSDHYPITLSVEGSL